VRYPEQLKYIRGSRAWGAAAAVLVLAAAAACLRLGQTHRPPAIIEFGLTALALAISIYYTPDYLHLGVNEDKRQRWKIKIRWRLIGAVVVLSWLSLYGASSAWWLVAATGWLTAANLLAGKVGRSYCSLYFWTTDFILLAALLFSGRMGLPLGAVLLAASAYLAVVIAEEYPLRWVSVVCILGCLLLFAIFRRREAVEASSYLAAAALLVITALATAFLVDRAQRHNRRNVAAAMRELVDFTGYPAERIRRLWSISNQELARNWASAGLDDSDPKRLAEWYRENSQLYLFAISGYNLDYKRIRSNLKVLRMARDSCLDYGAGNGEIVLELARQGHRVAYYDVEGETMKFARERALRQRLDVGFLHSKEDLAAWARTGGFDTVFSFDVLEHLPDLPGELNFLSSLLNRGGLLVFDVPAGSTKSHPMHLNHNLGIHAHMLAKGFKDERPFLLRLPFRKEEKYFFRAP
jgi:2-polyprenyl-3-methyl-5-hydroxy-6-metoxy-1,4-benzoquinol methylase